MKEEKNENHLFIRKAFSFISLSNMVSIDQEIKDKVKKIKCIITDVDGVLTDGAIIYDNEGMEYKHFNVKDGQIIQYLKAHGILVGVITGRDSQVVRNRCEELKMDFHYHGVKDKDDILQVVLDRYHLSLTALAYVGDDLNDLPILTQVGLSATPADGHYRVKEAVDLVLKTKGGQGALRELADVVLEVLGNYASILKKLKR